MESTSSSVVSPSAESLSKSARRSCSFIFELSTLEGDIDKSFSQNFLRSSTSDPGMINAFTGFGFGFGAPTVGRCKSGAECEY